MKRQCTENEIKTKYCKYCLHAKRRGSGRGFWCEKPKCDITDDEIKDYLEQCNKLGVMIWQY